MDLGRRPVVFGDLKILETNVGNELATTNKSTRRFSMNSGNMICSQCLKIVRTIVLKVHGLKESMFKSQNNFYLDGLNSLGSTIKVLY